MAISEESTSSQKLSSQGWIPLILTLKSYLFSPVHGSHFAHVRKDCAYIVQHFSSLVVMLDSGVTLILHGQNCLGHSKLLLVWKHIPGVRARRYSRHGSPWRWLHSGHEVWEMALYNWLAFSTEKCPLPSAYSTVANLRVFFCLFFGVFFFNFQKSSCST